jgi:hypothetical protein
MAVTRGQALFEGVRRSGPQALSEAKEGRSTPPYPWARRVAAVLVRADVRGVTPSRSAIVASGESSRKMRAAGEREGVERLTYYYGPADLTDCTSE